MRYWVPFCLIVASSAGTLAASHPGSQSPIVIPGHVEPVTTGPRQVITLTLTIQLPLGRAGLFDTDITLPEGWYRISPPAPLHLHQGRSALRLLHIGVPSHAPAGDYLLRFSVWSRDDPGRRAEHVIPVVIDPFQAVQVDVVEIPDFVVAGSEVRSTFLVTNGSNTALTFTMTGDTHPKSDIEINPEVIDLLPGQKAQVVAFSATDAATNRQAISHITVRATAEDGTTGFARVSVDVLPTAPGSTERYHSIPSTLALNLLSGDRRGRGAVQLELWGEGTIDPDEIHHVSFHYLGPDDSSATSKLGRRDEFTVSYWNKKVTFGLGDRGFSLTPLTQQGHYGRGLEATGVTGDWQFGGYYMRDRFQDWSEGAAHINFNPTRTAGLGLHYLQKDDGATSGVAGFRGHLGVGTGLLAEFEWSRNTRGEVAGANAFDLMMSGIVGRVSFEARTILADFGFEGYYSDKRYHWVMANVRLSDTSDIVASCRLDRTNVDLMSGRTAPEETEIKLAYLRVLSGDGRFAVRLEQRRFGDRRAASDFDRRRKMAALDVSRRIGNINLHGSVQYGRQENLLMGRTGPLRSYTVFASFFPRPDKSLYASLSHQENLSELGTRDTDVSLGGTLALGPGFHLGLNLNHHENENRKTRGAQVRLSYRTRRGHTLALVGRHTGDGTDPAIWVQYALPFNLPVTPMPDLGRLKGRVVEADTGRGLANVVVSAGGFVTATDSQGRFDFPSLPAGVQTVTIDLGARSVAMVPVLPMPFTLLIEGKATSRLDIRLTRAASIDGRLILTRLEPTVSPSQDAEVPDSPSPTGGIAGALVVLRRNTETFHCLTDASGAFKFSGLRPGTWVVHIKEGTLPDHTELSDQDHTVKLVAGEHRDLEWSVVPVIRPLVMQEGGETLRIRRSPH